MDNSYRQLADTKQVNLHITRVATEIIADFPANSPLFVALLRGAAPFASQLMTSIVRQCPDYHPELDYMMVRTYGDERSAGQPQIITDIAPGTIIAGRDVIILDDVLDKGITAHFVANHLSNKGAASTKLAVLCAKSTERTHDISTDYSCFEFADNWLVGMGMDDAKAANEGYRWLQEIWEIKRS